MTDFGAKTTHEHWEHVWSVQPRSRPPSPLNVDVRNIQRLLARHVTAGDRLLEIGCAPGKILAWAAAELGAEVAGLDYSEQGIAFSRKLFADLGLTADLRCEDLLETSFENGSFDVVFSAGVIEHFDDPGPVVSRHMDLVRAGGVAVIAVPNYGGIYGRLQRRLDPANLAIHNTTIMTPDAMAALAPRDLGLEVEAYHWGRLSPWLLGLDRLRPRGAWRTVSLALNAAGLVQPFALPAIAPMLVLAIRRPA